MANVSWLAMHAWLISIRVQGTSLPDSTPALRPTEQARLAARSRSATARWIPGRVGADRYLGC
eukprot:COSAG01_NODE_44789_length_415_cov_2.569620_2_plen_62_part_01